jgi:hypothetical protein
MCNNGPPPPFYLPSLPLASLASQLSSYRKEAEPLTGQQRPRTMSSHARRISAPRQHGRKDGSYGHLTAQSAHSAPPGPHPPDGRTWLVCQEPASFTHPTSSLQSPKQSQRSLVLSTPSSILLIGKGAGGANSGLLLNAPQQTRRGTIDCAPSRLPRCIEAAELG